MKIWYGELIGRMESMNPNWSKQSNQAHLGLLWDLKKN